MKEVYFGSWFWKLGSPEWGEGAKLFSGMLFQLLVVSCKAS